MSFEGLYQAAMTKTFVEAGMARHQASAQELVDTNEALYAQNQDQARKIRELELLLARLKGALVEAKLQNAGLKAQVLALRSALVKSAPKDAIFSKTGKYYPGGAEQTKLSFVYDEAFDIEAKAMKLPHDGKAYRLLAK